MILSAFTAARMMLCIESDPDAISAAIESRTLDLPLDDFQPELIAFIDFLDPTDSDHDAIDRALDDMR